MLGTAQALFALLEPTFLWPFTVGQLDAELRALDAQCDGEREGSTAQAQPAASLSQTARVVQLTRLLEFLLEHVSPLNVCVCSRVRLAGSVRTCLLLITVVSSSYQLRCIQLSS